ncbi:hypothetical protein LCGC14_1410980 [marine sediment metagenome]|uniref:Uncharacterized protein n=1 Tax=marine sediment metagenome TaxID=412755 RepID=A0A0F9JUD0_9ZZZZ
MRLTMPLLTDIEIRRIVFERNRYKRVLEEVRDELIGIAHALEEESEDPSMPEGVYVKIDQALAGTLTDMMAAGLLCDVLDRQIGDA